jgi:hypothetical protein
MFLFIGLLCASLACTAYAGDVVKVVQVASTPASKGEYRLDVTVLEDNPFYDTLSGESLSALESVRSGVSPELVNLCREKTGHKTKCNGFLMDLAQKHFTSAGITCRGVLMTNDSSDSFTVNRACEKLEPTILAWQENWKAREAIIKATADDLNKKSNK